MLYNKPRDVKLRVLPSVSSVIKRADTVKNKFTKNGKNDDADKLILLNETVPQGNGAAANVVVPEKKAKYSTVINKNVEGVEDNDFDIILTVPPVKQDEDIVIDLTEMPVIEGIPMLSLPDEPRKAPETKHREIVYIDTPKAEKTLEVTTPSVKEDDIFDLSEMPDIDGIPMLELKPVTEEKIQLLEDFVYEPVKEIKHAPVYIPRPNIDFDEPVYTPKVEKLKEKSVIELLPEIAKEPVVELLPEIEEITEEPVVELIPEVEEVTEEPVVELIPDVEEITEESVVELLPEVEEITEEPVVELLPEVEEITEEPVVELLPEVEEITEEPGVELIPEVEEITEEPVVELLPEVEEVTKEPVVELLPEVEEITDEPVVELLPEVEEITDEPVVELLPEVEEVTKEPAKEKESTELIAPPPFVQTSVKRGRKAKKKEKQQKNKAAQPKSENIDIKAPAQDEHKDTVAAVEKKRKVPKEKKTKKTKPVITNKRRHLKKKGVKIKLRIKELIDIRRENRKKNARPLGKAHSLKVASFLLMLYMGTALAFAIPIRPTYSETEKRQLANFPEFTAQALVSGDYFSKIDTWFSDTFPFREGLTQTDTFIKSLYGIQDISIHGDVDEGDEIPDAPTVLPEEPQTPEVTEPVTMPDDDELSKDNGNPNAAKPDYDVQELSAIVVAGDSAYEYYSFSQDVAPRFIDRVNNLDSIVKPLGNVYSMIVPTSMDITLNDALRAEVNSANQKKALDYFNASFKNTVAVDGIYDSMREHRNEYIYFRADHHWTALGAYYAYEQFALEKGITPVPLSKYETKTFDNFIGTFYSSSGQNPALKKNPDYVTAYLPYNNVTCKISDSVLYEGFDYDVIKDVSDHTPGSKYLTFIGGDNGLTTITNLDLPRGESCLVIKDSYANAFVPFLIPHYNKIYVIDPRHYKGTLTEFCESKTVNDVIVLTNISTTRNYIYLEGLENFVQ